MRPFTFKFQVSISQNHSQSIYKNNKYSNNWFIMIRVQIFMAVHILLAQPES